MRFKKYVNWLRDLLFKTHYDFDRPDPDFFNFHPQFLVVIALQGIFYAKRDSKLRFIWPFLCVNLTLVAIGLESMFVVHGVTTGDISLAIECFTYLVMLGVIPIVDCSILLNRDVILRSVDDMNADFQHVCSLGPKYRTLFLERQLLIWMLFIGWFTIYSTASMMLMTYPVIVLHYQSLFAIIDEHTIRPLAYPMWLPKDDPYRTPNYEIFLGLQMSFSFTFIQTFCGYVYVLFHVLLHYLTIMDLIILDFEVIFYGLDPSVVRLSKRHPRRIEVQRILQQRIRRVVTWHQSVFKAISTVSSVFGPPLVYQVMLTATVICLLSFRVASRLEEGVFDYLFVMMLICAPIQLWVPCYLGTLLRNKGFEVGDSCFTCGWNETPLGLLIRNDILLIIYRSQIPISIKFTGLPNIELETFSSSMSTSYTYFNMLRQYSNNLKS